MNWKSTFATNQIMKLNSKINEQTTLINTLTLMGKSTLTQKGIRNNYKSVINEYLSDFPELKE